MQDRTLTVRVARIVPMTDEVKAFELIHPWGGRLQGHGAGAHIDVHTPGGFRRQYSLARAAAGPGPVDRYLIGLTPLLAMAEQLAREGRDWRLFVFARSRAHLAFADALAALGSRVQLHLDDPAAPEKIDLRKLLAAPPGADAQLYLCGPAGFMQAARSAAAAWGEDRVHADYFAAPEVGSDAGRGEPFELRLTRRGLRVPVGAEQSAVQALADLGIDVPTSCEQGLCGTCVVRWHPDDGSEPLHRDFCLTGVERRDKVALCCSRARHGVLVVDL